MSNRQTFDAAYSKLEATIRNFSKEKLSYESNISKLNFTITSLKSDIESLNSNIQKLEIEKQQTDITWKQDEEHRCAVEAALIESEKKIDAYWTSLQHFESLLQNINHQIEAMENTIRTCKYRQNELLDHIFLTEEMRSAEKRSFQDTAKKHNEYLIRITNEHQLGMQEKEKKITELQEMATENQENWTKLFEDLNIQLDLRKIETKDLELKITGLEATIKDREEALNAKCNEHTTYLMNITNEHQFGMQEKEKKITELEKLANEKQENWTKMFEDLNIQLDLRKTETKDLELKITGLETSIKDREEELNTKCNEHTTYLMNITNEHKLGMQEKEEKITELEKMASENQENWTKLIEDLNIQLDLRKTETNDLELKIAGLETSIKDREEELNTKCNEHAIYLMNITNEHQLGMQEKEKKITELEKMASENQENWTKLIEDLNIQLDLKKTETKDLELKMTGLETSIKDREEELNTKCNEHNTAMEEITKSNQALMEEKNAQLFELDNKLSQLEDKLNTALKCANEELEKSCEKIRDLEQQISVKEGAIEKLEQVLHEKEIVLNSSVREIENLRLEIEEQKASSLKNLTNFREMYAEKEELDKMYSQKLKSIGKELDDTNAELSNLKALYQSRERAITKFMMETKPTIPISFQTNSQQQVKAPATSYALDKECQENIGEPKKNNKTKKEKDKKEKVKQVFPMSPKTYAKPTLQSKSALNLRGPIPSKSTNSGILKTQVPSNSEVNEKKVSFKEPQKSEFNFKNYFAFDSSSGNSDYDSPVKESKDAKVSNAKGKGNKRNAVPVETEKTTPTKKDKPSTGTGNVDLDPIRETPKTPGSAKKFFRNRK